MSTSDWDAAGLDVFFKSNYRFEDAELLAQLWNIPIAEAKQAIGHKIIHGIEDLLPDKIRPEPKVIDPSPWHPKGFKAYANSRYSYEDAELLAQLWNIPIEEAKQAIGHKIIHGIEDLLPKGVEPDPKVHEPKADWDAKALDAFFNSQYTYDDAERLARLWGQADAYAGKKLIGAKILNGQEKLIPFLLKSAPGNNSDEKSLDMFFKSDYTYDDALLLSQLWNIDIVEAKKTIGFKMLNNAEDALPDKIRRNGTPPDNANKLLDVFFDSDYTYDDATVLSQLWNIGVVEAKKTIGFKVVSGYEEALPVKIRRAVG